MKFLIAAHADTVCPEPLRNSILEGFISISTCSLQFLFYCVQVVMLNIDTHQMQLCANNHVVSIHHIITIQSYTTWAIMWYTEAIYELFRSTLKRLM